MKKILLILFLSQYSILNTKYSNAQTFQKYYDRDLGTTNSIGELGHSVQQTVDGGYITVGISDNYGIGMKDIYAVRLNNGGDTIWTKLYGNAGGNDMARSVIQTSDGGFAIAGETQSGAGGIDAVILKIDSTGDLLWSKAFGGSGNELGHAIIEMNDEGLVLAGQALSYSGTGYDEIFLVKVNKSGNFLWAKTLSGGSGEVARGIAKTADGGFVISGEESSFNYGVFIAKFNMNGDTTWCRGYRAAITAYEGFGINQTADGGYIMAANTYAGSIGAKDMVALKVTSAGAVNWAKEFGTINSDQATDIIQANDGGYVISGTATPGGSYSDLVLVKINASGVLQWGKNYSGEYGTTYAMDARFQVIQTSDNGFMTTGSMYNNFGNTLPALYNGFDMMLVKTDSSGGGLVTGCVRNANLQSAVTTWTAFSAPFIVTAITPTVTNSVFSQKFTAGNTGDVAIKINTSSTAASCGSCDGSVTADPCDSSGFYCSGKNPYTFLWSDASNQATPTATGLCIGSFVITMTDFVGCTGTATAVINSGAVSVDICLVTVDSLLQNNIIVWDKPLNAPIDSFIIYRDTANNNYAPIAAVSYDFLSQFIDTVRSLYTANGDPKASSWRYKIAVMDTCGNLSAMSPYHQSIFIQQISGNFSWNHYQIEGQPAPVPGLSNYLFQRDDSSNGNFATIQSLIASSTAYTDPQYSTYQNTAAWRVRTQWNTTCTAGKKGTDFNSSISNTTNTLSVGINNQPASGGNNEQFRVYPNPGSGVFTMELEGIKEIREIKVFDVLGREVYKFKAQNSKLKINPKSQDPRGEFEIDLSGQPAGVYHLHIISDFFTAGKRFIIQ